MASYLHGFEWVDGVVLAEEREVTNQRKTSWPWNIRRKCKHQHRSGVVPSAIEMFLLVESGPAFKKINSFKFKDEETHRWTLDPERKSM
jgi:hypothetical protein